MNPWLVATGLCTLLIGAVHSVMGELHIVWASWHLVSAFGLGVAALLFVAAQPDVPPPLRDLLVHCAVGIMLLAAALVAFATRGRHLAWLALSLTSALAMAGTA